MQGLALNEQGIKGIKNGTKTMTRRQIKNIDHDLGISLLKSYSNEEELNTYIYEISKYHVGEVVYVQEEFVHCECEGICESCRNGDETIYRANCKEDGSYKDYYYLCEDEMAWQPPHEMQEHQARYFLKIKSIKVERLQDISEEDCIKEGIQKDYVFTIDRTLICAKAGVGQQLSSVNTESKTICKNTFKEYIWNNLPYKSPYDWDSNPWVFVYEFERVGR